MQNTIVKRILSKGYSVLLAHRADGKSPICVVFDILWNGSVVRVIVATLKVVALEFYVQSRSCWI